MRNRLANTGDVTSEKRVITVVRVPCRGDRGLTGWILTHKEDREESTVVQGHVGRSVGGGGSNLTVSLLRVENSHWKYST